ncbi:WD repeat-containing protein mio [Mytilus galloprovincialis]|uniref:WD repeat-containing protein mio n=2 Tax=Mytilus galloprovincialis TaxID=29158 RepID=A0A8B6EUF2_MYTGA|nr:WD repeat-containing protein mio [Mytilus galloprovincialis]
MSLTKVLWSPINSDKFLSYCGTKINLYNVIKYEEKIGSHGTQGKILSEDSVAVPQGEQLEINLLKTVEWCPKPEHDDVIACGLVNGKVQLRSFDKDSNSDLVDKEFVPRHPRHCLYLFWNHMDSSLLAEGLDKSRNDSCILIWNVKSGGEYERQRYSSNTSESSSIYKPFLEIGNYNDMTASFSWFRKDSRLFVCGMNNRHLRIYDLRDAKEPKQSTTTKLINGVVTDPKNQNRIASFHENNVSVWDTRHFDKPILTLQEPKNIVKLRWCPTRNGFLGVLYRESTSVKLYDIRHTPQGIDELEPNYIDRTISPNNGGQYVTAFNWHPKQENRLLIACTNGAIKDMIVHERIPVIFSPQFHITWGNGKKLVDQELKSTDISLLMKERASKGYGLQSDHVFHNVQLVKEDAKLYGMWRWLSLSHDMVEEPKSQGQSYKHSGVYHLMDFNKGSTMKYQSFQYTDGSTGTKYFMRQYLSEERDKVLQLCGWGNSDNTEGLNLFLKELHKNGQTSKAAAIALFNLKFGQTIEILSGKYRHQTEDSTMMNAVAMAISGYSEDKQTLWRKTCSALLHKLTDPYLRAIFAFLSCEKDNYQEILDMKDLNLCDRVAFAALYLSDSKLQEFMESLIKEVKENGDLDGLLLTGLTSDGIDLLQRHLDRTGDIQTVALAIVYSLPCDITKEDKEKVVMWIQCYREMLDRWQLWHYRAKLDIIWHQNDTSTRVPSQAFISCNFCGKSIACNLPMVQRSLPFMSGPMAANFNRPKVTCCPGCRKPLPRCALCLTNLGTPSGTGLYHHKEKLGLDSKLSPFQDWFSWCQSCRHGGHVSHLFEWFDEHSECPVTGCTCNCVSRDHLERLSLKAVV